MNAKKVLGFVLCSSAFTKRNISSVGLVLIFFLVYVLAGGKVDTKLPRARDVGVFGSQSGQVSSSKEVLGIVPTEDRAQREEARLKQGRIFTDEEAIEGAQEEIDRSGLIAGEENSYGTKRERGLAERRERALRREVDPLDAIEERLRKSSR